MHGIHIFLAHMHDLHTKTQKDKKREREREKVRETEKKHSLEPTAAHFTCKWQCFADLGHSPDFVCPGHEVDARGKETG